MKLKIACWLMATVLIAQAVAFVVIYYSHNEALAYYYYDANKQLHTHHIGFK